MKQHKKNTQSNDDKSSKLVQHCQTMKQTFNFDEPHILAFESNERKRQIKEAFLTKKFAHCPSETSCKQDLEILG